MQQMTLASSFVQEDNSKLEAKKHQNQVKPIETKRIPGLEKLAQKIILKDNKEVMGNFKGMGIDTDGRYVCFEQDSDLFFMSYRQGTKEEEILGKAFRGVKHNRRLRIRKFSSPDIPITVEKIPNFKSNFPKANPLYLVPRIEILAST